MSTNNPRTDASPVAISGAVGSTMSLYDFLKQAYGDNVDHLQSVFVNVNGVFGSYWKPNDPHATHVLDAAGHDISSAGENINFADFKNVKIVIGNNINTNVFVTVPESSGNGPFVGHSLGVAVLPQELQSNHAPDHVPTAADVVAAAKMFVGVEGGVFNQNDCHGIASAIAASAGATLDVNSGNTTDIATNPNEQSGFWRIASTNGGPGWVNEVRPGDIVRLEHLNQGGGESPHTMTVIQGLNGDGQHPGQIQVVDNFNSSIGAHWETWDNAARQDSTATVPGTVTIYRLATDGQYLTDQSSDTTNDNILGTNFNDLIKVGSGSDTVNGGAGTDTVALAGNKADYKVDHHADGSVSVTNTHTGAVDTLISVEKVQFSDGTIDLSPTPPPPPPPPPPQAPVVSIDNVSVTEGKDGTVIETFHVTRTGGEGAFNVNFATADGTATVADGDYDKNSGVLQFAQGEDKKTIQVVVHGDTKVEANETFNVNLSGATNGATISHAQGIGTIVNDDVAPPPPPQAPVVSIDNPTVVEGNNGTVTEIFTVTRTGGEGAFDVHYATQADTASAADGDYVGKSGTLHFDAGVDKQTISITVNSDTKVEANETFHVNLSAATNGATISHAQGIGTIINDDTTPVTHHVANDFNGDGISDVLFGNGKGQVALWELNGNHIASNTTVGSVGSDWHSIGIGDFNADGKADVLWENSKGQVAEWQMNGDHVASNTTVGSVGTDWHAIGTGDFNGDGKADIVWENSKGQVAMWEMNSDHIASNTTVGSVGTDWHAIGTGDFNGDGKADLLWENSKGQVAMWEMNGDHIASNTTVGSVGTDWHVAGTGDFNGDGKTDVLWQNANGKVAEWQMNGDHIASNTTVGNAAGSTVIGTGDYNHDGKADVLLQTASGHVTEWQMNGDHVTDTETVGSHSIDWHNI